MNMRNPQRTTTALKLAVAGLAGNAAGIWLQAFSGDPDYPAIPPGPIVLIVVALMVAFTHRRWWWTPIIGTLFKGKSERASRTELMVLITPRLVRPLDPDEVPPLPTQPREFLPAPEKEVKEPPPADAPAPR